MIHVARNLGIYLYQGHSEATDYDYVALFYAPKARENLTNILALSMLLTRTYFRLGVSPTRRTILSGGQTHLF